MEVILGGGFGDNEAPCPLPPMGPKGRDRLVEEAQRRGYTVVVDRSDLKRAVQNHPLRLLGLFGQGP